MTSDTTPTELEAQASTILDLARFASSAEGLNLAAADSIDPATLAIYLTSGAQWLAENGYEQHAPRVQGIAEAWRQVSDLAATIAEAVGAYYRTKGPPPQAPSSPRVTVAALAAALGRLRREDRLKAARAASGAGPQGEA